MVNKNEIQNLIKDLIEKTTVVLKDISVSENEPGSVWFSIEVEEPHLFISQGAEGLHALNHLVHRILENKSGEVEKQNQNILLDINGFQKKRVESVRAIAHMMSERARYFKSNIEVDPMSAFERRIIHEFLSDAPDLKTESIGTGRSRRVVIKYTGAI